jgi:hypothetical protein
MESDNRKNLPHEKRRLPLDALCFHCAHNDGNGRCDIYGAFAFIPQEQRYFDCKDAYDEKAIAMSAYGIERKKEE